MPTQTLNIGEQASSFNLPFSQNLVASPGQFVSKLLSAVLAIAAILVLIGLVTGALEWITSGGDKGKIEKAREKMTQAVIGMIVLAATLVIFSVMQYFLGINVLNFGGSSGSNSAFGSSAGGATSTKSTNPMIGGQKQPLLVPQAPQEQTKQGTIPAFMQK